MKVRLALLLLLAMMVSTQVYAGRGSGKQKPIPEPEPIQTPTITETVENHLLFLREEEKLARDVYLSFFDTYETPIFSNIASSEQRHMDAVKKLLDTYGLADPTEGNEEGEFTDQDLAALYDELVAKGTENDDVKDALLQGIFIEEYDILDIIDILAIQGLPADVKQVCENLLRGSRNHLRAFVGQWEALTGETYVPVLMLDEDGQPSELYKTIIAGDKETGRNSKAGNKNQRGSKKQAQNNRGKTNTRTSTRNGTSTNTRKSTNTRNRSKMQSCDQSCDPVTTERKQQRATGGGRR